jgi:hypothetical protein
MVKAEIPASKEAGYNNLLPTCAGVVARVFRPGVVMFFNAKSGPPTPRRVGLHAASASL